MWCLLDDELTKNNVLEMGCRVLFVDVPQHNVDKDNIRTLINYDTGEKIIVKDCDLDKYNVLGRCNKSDNELKCYVFISKLGYKLLEYVDLEIIKDEEITDFEKNCKDYYCRDYYVTDITDYYVEDEYGLVWSISGRNFDLLHMLHEIEKHHNIDLTNYKKLIIYSGTLKCKYIITFSSKFNVFFSKARYLTNNFEGRLVQ